MNLVQDVFLVPKCVPARLIVLLRGEKLPIAVNVSEDAKCQPCNLSRVLPAFTKMHRTTPHPHPNPVG